MRSSPNSSGQGESDSIQLAGESVELTTVALELLALCLDDVRRRVLDEELVRQHPLGTGDLLLQPLDLRGRVPIPAAASGLHDSFEDPRFLAVECRADAAATEDRRGVLDCLQ